MSTIIGIIIVIAAGIFAFMLLFSCTDTYKKMTLEEMEKELPDKIIINIKYEKDDANDADEGAKP